MAEGQVYHIPEQAFPWFKEKMAQLGKKANRLVGEKLTLMVVGKHFEDPDSRGLRKRVYEVFVACPEVRINGWSFVARIDHSQEAGNVVRVVPGQDLPQGYRDAEPQCVHCGYKRRRRDTFVLRCDDGGEHKQIGSSCLRDFTGHRDANKWAKLAELVSEMGTLALRSRSYASDGEQELRDHRYIDLERFALCAAMAVMEYGWTSKARSKEMGKLSTHGIAESMFFDHGSSVVAEILERRPDAPRIAREAIEWAQALGDTDRELTDYEHNAHVIASSGALEHRHLGIAASIVGVYYTKHARTPSQAPRRVDFSRGTHQGQPGDRLTLEVTVHAVNRGDNSTRHMFYDAQENLYVWFATRENLAALKGKKVTIQCSVKTHTQYNGVQQTLINRVQVVPSSAS